MTMTKFWTINCALLAEEEFEVFVKDLEAFILTQDHNWELPQQDSEPWLAQFIEKYEHWPNRQFHNNRYPLQSYFHIDKKIAEVEAAEAV